MVPTDKPLVWLHGEVKTPRLSAAGRVEVGLLLRRLQRGEKLAMPSARPMPSIGPPSHEVRVNDENSTWRILYRVDPNAVVILEVFSKKTAQTPGVVIENCKRRLKEYDDA